MQPYTPHGDSNGIPAGFLLHLPYDATLYPSRGQQQDCPVAEPDLLPDATLYPSRGQQRLSTRVSPFMPLMQPYTPHGDSNLMDLLASEIQ